MNNKKYTGKLIAVDMYSCNADVMNDSEQVEQTIADLCAQFKMQMFKCTTCTEEDSTEYSVSAVCEKGHVMLHILPDVGFVTADVFSCAEAADPAALARAIRTYLGAEKAKITLVDRGDFGSEVDMKPHHNSKVKLIRRTKNFGRNLKKMMLKPRSI